MKILCVCSQGNKRSVFTRFLLNHKHDAIAVGVDANSPETIKMLSEWSDRILLAEPEMRKSIPVKQHKKIDLNFTIGPDIYSTNIVGILKVVLVNKLKRLKYI